jgi:hypothetical protein
MLNAAEEGEYATTNVNMHAQQVQGQLPISGMV